METVVFDRFITDIMVKNTRYTAGWTSVKRVSAAQKQYFDVQAVLPSIMAIHYLLKVWHYAGIKLLEHTKVTNCQKHCTSFCLLVFRSVSENWVSPKYMQWSSEDSISFIWMCSAEPMKRQIKYCPRACQKNILAVKKWSVVQLKMVNDKLSQSSQTLTHMKRNTWK